MTTYQSPGVYRQEVFLKPTAALPTGVPGFIGFADEAAASAEETAVALGSLPEGLQLPDAIPNDLRRIVRYDGDGKRLLCRGALPTVAYRELRALSLNETYRKALKELYQQSQTMLNKAVVLRRKDEFGQLFSALPQEESYLVDAVNGFFDNGGVYCYVVHADASADPKEALTTALDALSTLGDLDVVAGGDQVQRRSG